MATLSFPILYLVFTAYIILICHGRPSAKKDATESTPSIKELVDQRMSIHQKTLNKINNIAVRYEVAGALKVEIKNAIVRRLWGKEVSRYQEREKAALAKVQKYEIPLTICSYGTMLEEEFSDVMKMNNLIPSDVLAKTLAHNRYKVERKYRWKKLLEIGEKKGNPYILLIMKELKQYYMKTNKLEQIDKTCQEYQDFILRFCESIVKAIDEVRLDALHVCDNVVDTNMSLFYNALMC